MNIPPKEMAAAMTKVAQYMKVSADNSRMAKEVLEALFKKYKVPIMTVIDGGKK